MAAYWNEHGPPVHISVAAALGYKPPTPKPSKPGEPTKPAPGVERVRAVQDVAGFLADFGASGGVVN